MPTALELPFAAPIPRNHEVLVVTFLRDAKDAHFVVLDQTNSTLYCAEELWGALQQDAALATTDPIAVVTRWAAWTVSATLKASCVGALVMTKTWGDFAQKTRLLLETGATAPYR
jgi:hypothetical protein